MPDTNSEQEDSPKPWDQGQRDHLASNCEENRSF